MFTREAKVARDVRAFAAKLGNLPPLRGLAAERVDALVQELRDLVTVLLGDDAPAQVIEAQRAMPRENVVRELDVIQSSLHQLLPKLVPNVVLPFSTATAIGADVISPVELRTRITIRGRQLVPELVAAERDSLAVAIVQGLFGSPGRCPLWACRSCGAVIPQAPRGRLAKFCSARCKSHGVPSAALRNEYVKKHRRLRRDHEIARVGQAIAGLKRADHYGAVRDAFPEKPRRSLLHLLKIARGDLGI